MIESAYSFVLQSAGALGEALLVLLIAASVFALLALVTKGRTVFADARKALPETRVTLLIFGFNLIFVLPVMALYTTWLNDVVYGNGFHIVPRSLWESFPMPVLVVMAAIFIGDFVTYWRHRLQHTRILWPAHAVHHGDTEMTWLTLERSHPINLATSLTIDTGILVLLGLPPYAVIANNFVHHYYAYLLHADVPWTYGRFGHIFVSPAMHRWHHAKDRAAVDTNFAGVFSLFDKWFGTYRVPGRCESALGVSNPLGTTATSQLCYPLRPSSYRSLARGVSSLISRLRSGSRGDAAGLSGETPSARINTQG